MPTKKKADKPAKGSLAAALADLRSKDSELRLGSLSEFDMRPTPMSTGNIALDNAIGVGGLPRGKLIELYGISQSGKTTSALQTAAVHQAKVKAGEAEGAILYLDYEYSLDEAYCRSLGLDTEDRETFIYVQPKSLEQGCNLFRNLLRQGFLALAIFDSVAAMVTEKEQSEDTGTSKVADRAKMLTQFLRQVKGECWRQQTAIIFLNHVLEAIETGPRRPGMPAKTYTPGGRGLVFYSDLRIAYQQTTTQKGKVQNSVTNAEEEVQISTTVQAKVVKNKVSVPQRVALMRVRYGKGFSQPYSVYQVLVAYKIIKVASAWITLPALITGGDDELIQGEEKAIRRLEDDPELLGRALAEATRLVSDWTPDTETDDFDIDPTIDPETGEVKGAFTPDPDELNADDSGFERLKR